MVRFMKKISKKAGLPPGSLVHIGERKTEKARIRLIAYDERNFEEKDIERVEESFPLKPEPAVTWLNIDGIHQVDLIEKIGKQFRLHPLALEDVLNTDQRPKFDDYEDYICVILKMLTYNEKDNRLKVEQISLIVGQSLVISLQESEGDVFDPVRERLRKAKGRIRKMGSDYLAYALVDAIVDSYFVVLERIGEEIESLEDELLSDPKPETSRTIHRLKRELIFLRKSVWPLREVMGRLERGESTLVKEQTKPFLRDVYDHTVHVIDTVETFRDMVSGMMDVYLTSVSYKLNEIMKVLTIIATIFIPLTFIAGVYGMNFNYMPELEWRAGYALAWLLMIAVGVTLLVYFRRKRWI
ncbi:MAG: magnesium/cobalt transporter CorA [Desulfatiglandales bacterium]